MGLKLLIAAAPACVVAALALPSLATPSLAMSSLAGAPVAGDAAKGQVQFARCKACHAVDASSKRGIGPNLAGIVGRKAGSLAGYRYTPAMAEADFAWTPEKLDAFLEKPRAVVPGTNMVFAGISDPAARKAIVAYLATNE